MTLVSPPPKGPEYRFRDLLDAFPAAVYTTDSEGYITFFNQAAEALAGRTLKLGEDRWCVSWKMYAADGSPLPPEACPMALTLREGKAVRDVEIIAERPDGVRINLMPFPTPLRDAEGRMVGAVNMLADISAVKRAEAALARRADEQSALFRFTDRLHRAQSLTEVNEAALDAILMALRCHRASVLMFDDAGVMQFVGARGLSQKYRAAVAGHTPWTQGQAEAQPVIIEDVARAPIKENLRSALQEEGIGALAFFPLVANGGVIGKFMAYFDRPHVFADEEVDLALTISRQIGFSVGRARTEALLRDSEAEFRALADNIHQLAWMTDKSGWIHWYNQRWFDYTGTTLDEMKGWGWQAVHHPDHVDRVTEKFKAHIASGEAWEDTFPLRGKDGAYRWFLSRARPLLDEQGKIAKWCGTNTDITEQMRAEQAMHRLSAIVESSEDAIVSKNLDGIIVSWNAGAERLFGYRADEIVGLPVTTLMFPEHQGEEPGILERIRRGERIDHFETVRRRKDGSRVDISLTVSPVKNSKGEIVGASKIARDVSERKRADEQRTLLIHELNHRVKNTLATVQSLVMQTLRNTERSIDARALLDARLAALSRAHDLLTAQSWKSAGLSELVRRGLEPFSVVDGRVIVAGPDVRLTPRQAVALSIALHELATNAAKYGALSNEHGRVNVEWGVDEAGLKLTWRETGGPPVSPPTRTGFGTRLIERSLAHDLGGAAQIRYLESGAVAEISAPLEPALAGA